MFYGCTDLISLPDFDKMDKPGGSEEEIFCGCINLSYLPIDWMIFFLVRIYFHMNFFAVAL